MRTAKPTRALLAVTLLTVLALLIPAGRSGAAQLSRSPLRPLLTERQLVTVIASSRTTSYATFRAYQVIGTRHVLVFGPWTARVGYNGIAAPGAKREGD